MAGKRPLFDQGQNEGKENISVLLKRIILSLNGIRIISYTGYFQINHFDLNYFDFALLSLTLFLQAFSPSNRRFRPACIYLHYSGFSVLISATGSTLEPWINLSQSQVGQLHPLDTLRTRRTDASRIVVCHFRCFCA